MNSNWSPQVARALHELSDASPAAPALGSISDLQPRRPRRQPSLALTVGTIVLATGAVVGLVVVSQQRQATSPTVTTPSGVPASDPALPTNRLSELLAPGESELISQGPLSGRIDPAGAWTGTEMLIWGGATPKKTGGEIPLADGASYNPVTRVWRTLPAAPISARSNTASVWTGSEFLVWGGSDDGNSLTDGAAYNLAMDAWRPIPAFSLVSTIRPSTVWTGTEMIVLEGFNGSPRGAAYNPTTNSWRLIAEPPGRSVTPYPQAVWTGSEAVVELGAGADDQPILAAYDPVTDAWLQLDAPAIGQGQRPKLLWTGTEVLLLGATSAPTAWNPASRQWRELSQPEPTNALGVDPVWTGDAAVFWAVGDTATIYDSATDEWRNVDGGDLSPRLDALTVWADGILLSWSGFQSQPDGAATGAADGIAWRPPTT